MIRYSYDKCPHINKHQLVKWAQKHFKNTRHKADTNNKDQLYAMWHRVKRKGE